MVATLASAALVCAGSVLVGQGICRLAGCRQWTWISPAVGFCALMLLATAALHLPGRSATTAAISLALAILGGALMVREPRLRPPAAGLLAGVPAGLVALIPFAANGRFGTLGWSFYNDMSVHLLWAEAYRSQAVAAINPLPAAYPLGPHAFVATVAEGLGAGVDYAFTGLQIAVVLITAWTTLAALSRLSWWGRAAVATLSANVYMLASYYGEGAFKESIEAMLVLAFAMGLRELIASRRWPSPSLIPLSLIVAGSLSTYSYTGLIWPAATLAVLGAGGAAFGAVRWRSTRRLLVEHLADLRRLAFAAVLAAIVFVLVMVPQIPRLAHFFQQTTSGGAITPFSKENLGNLVQPLSGWEVFGIWTNPDFRFLPVNQLHQGLWTAAGVAAVVYGMVWWLSRRDFVLPATVIASFLVYALANRSESPYVVAKALVILSPMLVLLGGRALLDRETLPRPRAEMRWLCLGLAALVGFGAARSSYQALRFAIVGSTTHADELASFRPLLRGKRVLYLAADDFLWWELPDVRVSQPWPGTGPEHTLPSTAAVTFRPNKPWQYGQTIDFDGIEPSSYEQFAYVIAPRDADLSSPPTNLVLVRQTHEFDLFRRDGPTPDRLILDEGQNPGAVLECDTAAGRAIARQPGVAAIREAPIATALPDLAPGGAYSSTIALPAGQWLLTMPYFSAQPMTLRVGGRTFELPADLDRPGAGWPAGEVLLRASTNVRFTLNVHRTILPGIDQPVYPGALVATRDQSDRMISLRDACGKYVDWYLPSP